MASPLQSLLQSSLANQQLLAQTGQNMGRNLGQGFAALGQGISGFADNRQQQRLADMAKQRQFDQVQGAYLASQGVPVGQIGQTPADLLSQQPDYLPMDQHGPSPSRDTLASLGKEGYKPMNRAAMQGAMQFELDRDAQEAKTAGKVSLIKVDDGANTYLIDRYTGEMYDLWPKAGTTSAS